MKRILSTFSLLLFALITVHAQYRMEVKTKDGQSHYYLTDEIESVTWNPIISHEYVDLGLSVKWATCNIGATKPEEYGDYFAWGATEPYYEPGHAQDNPQTHWKPDMQDGYCINNAPFQTRTLGPYEGDAFARWTKYLGSTTSEFKDPSATDDDALKTVLDLKDDAAYVNWGDGWRMPTVDELNELRNNCTWLQTTLNGVAGFKITSNIPGYTDRWIFIPFSGMFSKDIFARSGSIFGIWSSSLYTDIVSRAYVCDYWPYDGVSYSPRIIEGSRFTGYTIRPVCPKESSTDTPTDAVLVTVNDLIDTEWEYCSYDSKTSTAPQPDIINIIYYEFITSTDVRQYIKENISGPGIWDTVIVKSDKILKYNLNDPYLTIGDQPLSFKFDSKYRFHSLDDDKVYEKIDY